MLRQVTAVAVAAILVMLSLSGCSLFNKEQAKTQEMLLTVAVTTAGRSDVAHEVSYSGTVTGSNEVMLYPKLAGKVTAVHVREGSPVSKGEVILTLDSSDYQTKLVTAQAAVSQAELNYENARNNLERTRGLYDQGAASPLQLEQAEIAAKQAEAALEQARAALQDARNLLNNCNVTAPISGVMGPVYVTEGNMASTASPVGVISSLDRVKVKIQVSEEDIRFVKKGNPVKVKVVSLDDTFQGRIENVSPIADPKTRSFPVEITFDNPGGRIKSGMFAEVILSAESKTGVLALPRNALLEKNARYVVFTLDDKSTVHEVEVKVGLQGRDKVEILSGLKEGDRVVVKGQTLLHDGDRVRVAAGGA